jgi:type IV secretory pathway VirB4 component
VLLAGVIGQGKSALAKSLAVRSIAAGRRVYVPGDPKGEWTSVATAVGGTVVALGAGLSARLNPLDQGHGDSDAATGRARRVRVVSALTEIILRRDLRPAEHTVLDAAVAQASNAHQNPTLNHIITALSQLRFAEVPGGSAVDLRRDASDLGHALLRLTRGTLAGLFDGPSTVALDAAAPMVVLDLSRLGSDDEAVTLAMTCASAWLESALTTDGGLRWIVYDEAWRLLRSLPVVRRMQAQWKLSRAYGIANLLVLHRLSDLDAAGAAGSEIRAVADGLLADCSTRVVYRQETDQVGGTARALGLTAPERALLPGLPRGTGLWTLPGRSYVVRHQLHPDELTVFDTDAAMRDRREHGQ